MAKVPMDTVLRKLKRLYPHVSTSLNYTNPLELLVATILSAQCTDARVNVVTMALFKKYKKLEDYIAVSQRELERDIHSCGTFRMKAKAIQTTCKTILEKFCGKVPRTMKEMIQLRGVGRKTASIVLASVYGVIEGIPVDTHCIRLSRRLGLTRQKAQAKIERDLMRQTSRKDWVTLSHLLIAHGRAVCTARKPRCEKCVFKNECPSSTVRR